MARRSSRPSLPLPPFAACDTVKTNLLEATNPTVINPSSVQSAAGAVAVRNGALARLRTATADGESTWLFGGLLVDEWASSSTFVQNDETDQRSIQLNNATVNTTLRALYRVRTDANQAIALLNKYRPTPSSDVGEMYFARGFAELQLASDFCNGIPLSDGADNPVVLGKPLPVKDVFAAASASFDTAMTLSSGTDNASLQVNRAARIAKARALLGLGLSNAPAAATLVNGIADDLSLRRHVLAHRRTYDVVGSTGEPEPLHHQRQRAGQRTGRSPF